MARILKNYLSNILFNQTILQFLISNKKIFHNKFLLKQYYLINILKYQRKIIKNNDNIKISTQDLCVFAEFRQIEGPKILETVPQDPLINGVKQEKEKQLQENQEAEKLKILILKALSIKFNFTSQHFDRINNLPYNDDSYIITTFPELKEYTALCYFGYLPDLSARGYCRRVCLCFLSTNSQKIMRNYNQIVTGFSESLQILKYFMTITYRKEAVDYIQRLDKSISIINEEIEKVKNNIPSTNKVIFDQILHNYDEENLNKLKLHLIRQKSTLLKHHTLLHYKQQPLFLQLFQSDEIKDIKFKYEAEYLMLTGEQLEDQEIKAKESIIPDEYKQHFVTVAPHELRIIKRQELRSIDKLTTTKIYQYFLTIIRKLYNYYSKNLVDIELSQRNRCMVGQSIYFGNQIEIRTQLDRDIKLNELRQNNTFLTNNIQKVYNMNLKDLLQAQDCQCEDMQVFKNQNGQLVVKFDIKELKQQNINDYPYLLSTEGSTVSDECEQFGQLFTFLKDVLGQKVFYNLINQTLINQQSIIIIDNELLAFIIQQIMYSFCIQKTKNQLHILIENEQQNNFDLILQEKIKKDQDVQVLIKIILFDKIPELNKQIKLDKSKQNIIIISTQYQKLWYLLDKQCIQSTLTLDCEKIYNGKKDEQSQSFKSIQQRIQMCLKQYVLNTLYNQTQQIQGCDQQIYDRIKQLLKNDEYNQVYEINISQNKKFGTEKLNKKIEDAMDQCGIRVLTK